VLRGEGVEEGAITLVLTDDEGIRRLNARFRDRDRPTDVLAFSLTGVEEERSGATPGAGSGGERADEDEEGSYLGDVVVSLPRARAQAPRYRHSPEAELARLISHGILHLLGYDHHTPAEGRRMKKAERTALAGFARGSLWPREEGAPE
jgi:probable rRNA maturation factor